MDNEAGKRSRGGGLRAMISMGAKLTGGAVGGAMGLFAGGPIGAAALGAGGVLAAEALEKVGDELANRLLGPRECARVGALVAFAAKKIQDNIASGKAVRSDDFFEKKPDDRSTAEEIVEATMLAAQRDHQEQKLEYYGNLLANIASDATFDRAQANRLIKAAHELSWRQLCIMAVAPGTFANQLRQTNYRGQKTFSQSQIFLLTEVMDLYHQGFLNFGGEALLGPTDVEPSKMKLQAIGSHLYNLMELWRIPMAEIAPLISLLSQ